MCMELTGGVRNFCLEGPSCSTNIFIKTIPNTHIHMFFFFFIIYTFLFDKLYICTHPTKNKNLVFSIKIMFDDDLL